MPRLQGRAPRAHATAPSDDPRAARALRGEAARDRRDPPRRDQARAADRRRDHGPGTWRGEAGAVSPDAVSTLAGEASGLTVRIESFVGPLDLLLHLCRTNEMDLTRLSVRTITDQYLTHLESLQFQDLETAGSFMVMAATLIYLKSKLLLPQSPDDVDELLDEEGELLRQELAERLREYARIKVLGSWLATREAEQALLFGRGGNELPPPE